jgi:diketogulonate reductase-like aldo/keto reductase
MGHDAAALSGLNSSGDNRGEDMQTTRRTVLQGMLGATSAAMLPWPLAWAQSAAPLTRSIPSTNEDMPVVGLGTWITFNVGGDPVLLDECAAVMAAFFEAGGRMIDSSPMYGSSQPTIGYGLKRLDYPEALFSAEKVWISNVDEGPEQMEESRAEWGVPSFDLMQVHNLVSWERHLDRLFAMKAEGRLRYVGITTSHGRRHGELERIMTTQPIDFVQLTYNVLDREPEQRLLPIAQERGIGVIVNRPYRQGALIRRFDGYDLPDWASETGAASWAQFLLKFIISHPAVTCAIPATTRTDHVRENLAAASGIMPDEALRQRMIQYIEQL